MRFHIHKFDKLPYKSDPSRYIAGEYLSFQTGVGEAKFTVLKCIKCPKLKLSLKWEDDA